jgi:pimeloyl-ACP methyl ester carboxylesterase
MIERCLVETQDGNVAAELHRNQGVGTRVLTVFVPGAPRNASQTRVTSGWESAITEAVQQPDAAFVTFNYVGIGASAGRMSDTSIATRRSQVQAIIRYAHDATEARCLVLVGCSMGGHIVATLARKCKADGVALVVPAAYGSRAEGVNFGPRLTAELRRPHSWRDSPALAEYRLFSGRKLLIAPQDDEVVPAEITDTYADSTDKKFVWRPTGVSHRFLACLTAEDQAATEESIKRIAAFVELCASEASSAHPPSTEAGAVA